MLKITPWFSRSMQLHVCINFIYVFKFIAGRFNGVILKRKSYLIINKLYILLLYINVILKKHIIFLRLIFN